MIMYIRTFC